MPKEEGKLTSKPRSLAARGIAILSRREHSRKELREKLLEYEEDPEKVEATLDEFEKKGFLSDERFAEALCRARSKRYGNFRLSVELREAGVASEIANRAIESVPSEAERAQEIWDRRFGSAAENEKDRQKQIRFLANRGFSFDTIRRVLECARCES